MKTARVGLTICPSLKFLISSRFKIDGIGMKYILTALGLVALGLGILGIFLPVLPTTPFLLLAAALFLRSSRSLYDWLLNHPKLGPYISNFMVHKSIPLHVKVISVSMVWITLLYCAIAVAEHWAFRLMFIAIATGVTIHILSYRTSGRSSEDE